MKQILASIVPGSLSRAGASLTMWTLAFFPGAKEELDHREAWDLDSQLE
jgi:hypothetical protein